MHLVNMSRLAFVNEYGLNIPCIINDEDGELCYEHTFVAFRGFDDSDFGFSSEGKPVLLAHCFPVVTEGNVLTLIKPKHRMFDDVVLFLYSFPIMEGGEFGVFPGNIPPEAIYKFKSGNPDSGYFYELMLILKKDILYEILYHSEKISKITSCEFKWDSKQNWISTNFRIIL